MNTSRALFVIATFLLAFILIIARLYHIQINKHEYYSILAENQQNYVRKIKAERGVIKDREGTILSYTKDNATFFVDKRMMKNNLPDSIANAFSKIMQKNKSYYLNLIKSGTKIVYLEKNVSYDKAALLKELSIDGLGYTEDYSRVYPYGSLASHILGFVNKDMKGTNGIEKVYNQKLTGIDGVYFIEKDVKGGIITFDNSQTKASIPGNSVVLTINKTYQNILEEELSKGITEFNAKSATAIIMNPNTGEILSLANFPDYDPANYNLFEADNRRNRALTDTYEPGSTFKAIIMSMMFEKNVVNENEIIDTENGDFLFKKVHIRDSHKHISLNVREVLEQSSNIGMAKLSQRLDDEELYKYLRDFGFSIPTAIDLPSESPGYLKLPSKFSAISKAFISYGYEVSVTPLQLINAYSALINGGYLYKPYIVKEITNSNGIEIENKEPQRIRKVVSESTSKKMRDIMIGVVESGTGKAAMLENVLVGGKTGTSQLLVNNSYSSNAHNSSFVGFFPADNPKIIMLIVYHSPVNGKYGGIVAAPVFARVADRIIQADISILDGSKKIERKENLFENMIAENSVVLPIEKKESKAFLNPNKVSIEKAVSKPATRIIDKSSMPDLANKSQRDGIAILNTLGVKYRIEGSGRIVWQSIIAGSPIDKTQICVLICESQNKKIPVNIN
ncbi:MAG: transpeptidase family protein [Melioribacteraceae bacterium]|nr:transpeptidase family protein [Melioribacteraceae bacterium]